MSSMISSTNFSTMNAEKYIRRLCKHWSHRFVVEFDDHQGVINFGDSSCLLKSSPNNLYIHVITEESRLESMQQVIIEHLKRFTAQDESLDLVWQQG